MNLSSIILGENDDFLRVREACIEPVEKELKIPDKFQDDLYALANYIGVDKLKSGLCIDLTLAELLSIVPRKRRRTDAYDSLVKYLKDELNINLTIKNNKR